MALNELREDKKNLEKDILGMLTKFQQKYELASVDVKLDLLDVRDFASEPNNTIPHGITIIIEI